MAPCKWQVKATKHSGCDDCNNCVDLPRPVVRSPQADSFSFECRGCTKMKGLEVDRDWLRQVI